MKKTIIVLVVLVVLGVIAYMSYESTLAGDIRTTPLVDSATASSTSYTLADISAHKTSTDCWTTVEGKVYNLTSFIPSHPGGKAILPACGTDGTKLFESVRQHERANADDVLEMYQIGMLKQ